MGTLENNASGQEDKGGTMILQPFTLNARQHRPNSTDALLGSHLCLAAWTAVLRSSSEVIDLEVCNSWTDMMSMPECYQVLHVVSRLCLEGNS